MAVYTGFKGRVGAICDRVLTSLNDMKTGAHFCSDADLLIWVNDCQGDIASEGYWTSSCSLDVVAGQGTYDFDSLSDDNIVDIHNVVLTEANTGIQPIRNWKKFADTKKYRSASDGPAIFIHDQKIEILPIPTASTVDYLTLYYTYCPPELGSGLEITARSAAVTNLSNGLVGLPVTASTLVSGDELVVSGTTNYNGTYTAWAGSSSTVIVVNAAYHAETLSSSSAIIGRYYTPKIPKTRDDVFVYYCLMQACLKDLGRRANLYQAFSAEYKRAKVALLSKRIHLRRVMGPVR